MTINVSNPCSASTPDVVAPVQFQDRPGRGGSQAGKEQRQTGLLTSLLHLPQCSVTCGKGMQSRVIQCMHKITGRHGNECFSSEKPAAYRPCHLQPCNEKINVNTITSPRLGKQTPRGMAWRILETLVASSVWCSMLGLGINVD